jgi:phenylacetate-CoA ligase
MAEERGYRYALDKVLLGGENLSDTQRERFRHYWDTEVFDTYGATEIGGGQTITLPECPAFHLNDLYLVTEIVDPETGQAADEGALVFTTLMREAMPLLRYRLGDLACWQESNCWLPFSAIELTGRMDDRVEAGGAALYASRIADVIAQVPGSRGRVEMRLDKVELTDRLTLRIAGEGVKEQAVREALFKVYPRIRTNLENESLVLDIETDASLTDQIKAVKLVDERT